MAKGSNSQRAADVSGLVARPLRITKPVPLRFALAALFCAFLSDSWASHAQEPQPTFKASIALVPMTAVVRDAHNRLVQDLGRDDFQVLENGLPRPIVDFNATEQGAVSVAVLFDTSGSMRIGSNLEAGKGVVEHLLSWMEPGRDEVALFTFDRAVRREASFTADHDQIRRALRNLAPTGVTSLYDAMAETATQLGDRGSHRRALVVITDGADTSSTLTPPEVSAVASAIDVPVYVMAVVSPLEHRDVASGVAEADEPCGLSNVAHWTGGRLTYISAPAHASVASRGIITELRHQYWLAIESAMTPGWHRLEVMTRRKGLSVRTRTGYFASAPPSIGLSLVPAVPLAFLLLAPAALATAEQGRRAGATWVRVEASGGSGVIRTVVEIDPAALKQAGWLSGWDLRLVVEAEGGAGTDTVDSVLEPGERLATVTSKSGLAPGRYTIRAEVKAKRAPLVLRATTTAVVPASTAIAGTAALARRRGPGTAMAYEATADPRFRRTERLRIEVPIWIEDVATSARVLTVRSQPIPLAVTVSERVEGSETLAVAEVNLAPLAEGDYVFEMSFAGIGKSEVVVYPFRLVP